MNLHSSTSKTLWGTAVTGIAIIVVGLIASMLNYGESILWLGLLILIMSPIFGVIVSAVSLFINRDYAWMTVALVLITMTAASIILAAYL